MVNKKVGLAQPPVVIAGLYLPGISLLRNFSRRGIRAFGIDSDASVVGFHTRYGEKLVCPDPEREPEAWLDFMVKLGAQSGGRAVLIPTADKFVLPIDAFASRLKEFFVFANPPDLLQTRLTNKRDTFALAAQHGFPIPKTRFPTSERDLEDFGLDAEFPCLIKPELSLSWAQAGPTTPVYGRKVLIAQSVEELVALYRQVAEIDPRVIVQEVIQGPDENLLYFICYLTRRQEVLGAFAGRKVRVIPIHFGSASFVETIYDAPLEEQSCRFLRDMGYWGICGIEVKRDSRDGKLKLVEINPRYGLWDEIGQHIGVDIGYIAYQDLLGLPVSPRRALRPHHSWVSLERDLPAFFEYKREGLVTFRSWLSSLSGPILWTDVSLKDWRVTWFVVQRLLRGAMKRLSRRLAFVFSSANNALQARPNGREF